MAVGRGLAVLGLVLGVIAAPRVNVSAAEPNFEDDVLPILQARCLKCHGGEMTKAGLDVRRRFTILAGGDGGAGIVPGKPDESLLIEKIVSKEMPPKEDDPLDAKQIDLLKRWVAAGAPTKGAKELPLESQDDETGPSEADRQFWAFQPPVRREPPVVKAADRVRTPIDAFLLAKLEEKGLAFNADAARNVLLRRLCFDLTGLPPTPEQLKTFLADARPDAYERLVDELLDSPRYGERWGRHWLDVAGYADSDGYLEADRERPEAYRYRDYVIKSFNSDKPFDQFVREQLAGDELSDWRRAEKLTPEVQEQLIATGFLRTAADPTYPGYKEKPEIYKVLADTVQIVSSTFLGVSVQCARCHSHKHEPIAQREYYQLQSIFIASYDPDRWLASSERAVPLATEIEQAQINAFNSQVTQRVAQLTARLTEIKNGIRGKLVDDALKDAWQDIHEKFTGTELAPGWLVRLDGTATGWKPSFDGKKLSIKDIEGKQGYATVRISRPVALNGEFKAECDLSWTSQDTGPNDNHAMQIVLLNLRDAQGNTIASRGFVDENKALRGSPVAGIGVGPDVVAHNLATFQLPAPKDLAYVLSASGKASVSITRNAAGEIVAGWNDGQLQTQITGKSAAPVAEVELEIRRYVFPGATFEGLTIERLDVTGQQAVPDDATRAKIREALIAAAPSDEQKKLLMEKAPRLILSDTSLLLAAQSRFPEEQAEATRILAVVAAEQGLVKTIPQIRGLSDLDDKPAATPLLRRGDFNSKGKIVEPGVPSVLAPVNFEFKPTGGYKTSGRRRAFAEWLLSPSHPTTARVQVNRIWAQHFGRGLVETVEDFGHLGKKPSHPELLDWLATEFIARKWSQKSLHRLIVTSSAYRQSSQFDESKGTADPENTLLWAFRPQRHEGEVVRDSLLSLSGQLNLEMFGLPVAVGPQGDGSFGAADDAQGHRRSIYLKVRRSQPVTLLETFDTPKMEVNCARRTEAIVATQALVLLNSPFVESSAQRFAARLIASAPDRPSRIANAYQWLFIREPSETERAAIQNFLDEFVQAQLGDQAATATTEQRNAAEAAGWSQAALTWFNSNEFLWAD